MYNNLHSNFRKNVDTLLYNSVNQLDSNEQIGVILLTIKDWLKIKTFISKTNRKKFKAEFTHYLSARIQKDLKLNCYLDCNHNWFNSMGWRGTYYCISCGMKIKAEICSFENLENLRICLKWNGSSNHETIRKPSQCRGKKRKDYALQISNEGTSNFRSNMILENKAG